MVAPPHIRPSEDKDAVAILVELLKPGAWIPPAQAQRLQIIEALLEFVQGVPLLDDESRRDAARLVFRRLVLDPLFSGLPESIFRADPHAGNLMVQTQKHVPPTLVLLDWSQAGRLSAPLRHALIALCLYCVTSDQPSPEVLKRLLESDRSGSPTRTRAAHFAGTVRKKFVQVQKDCWHVPEIRAMV